MSSWAVMLQGSPRGSCPPATRSRAKGGGAGGIRTLDRALQPYNGLANRRLQPLGHSSVTADMPDAGASRKRQIQVALRPFGGAAVSSARLKPVLQVCRAVLQAFAADFANLQPPFDRSAPCLARPGFDVAEAS